MNLRSLFRCFSSSPISPFFPSSSFSIHASFYTSTLALTSPPNPTSTLKDFCSLIRTLSNNNRNFTLLSHLDSLLTKSHLFDSATSVFFIHALSHLKKLTRAKTLVRDLRGKGKVSDFFLYSLVIQCLVKEGRIKDAELIWTDICSPNTPVPINVSDFVIYICKFGGLSEIEWVYNRVLLGDGVLNQENYIALVGALCKKNASLLALNVLRDMEENGFEPDDLTYLGLFQCLCRNGKLFEADLVLRSLVQRKSKIDICVFGSFIYGLCKSGKFREADKLFNKLIQRGKLSEPITNLKKGRRVIFQLDCRRAVPEIIAYETYFRSLCSVGRLNNAESLLKEMMRRKTSLETCVYRSFIRALIRAGRLEDAVRFFNLERKKGIVQMEELLGSLIMGFCEIGKINEARRLLDEFVATSGSIPDISICNCVLGGYWKEERIEEAMEFFESMKNGRYGGTNGSVYVIMVNGFCSCGDVEKGISIFREMVEKNIQVTGSMYVAFVRGLSECGRLDEAHGYLNEMMEAGHLVSYFEWKELFDFICVTNVEDLSLGF